MINVRHVRKRSQRQHHIKEIKLEATVETYSALGAPCQNGVKVIESLNAYFNNSMLQAIKGEINGIDDSYPNSGMTVEYTTHYFNEANQQGFQVDPRESNLIDINKIIRYLKGLPILGVKHPKDIMLNMFGYIDIDYAGCKKDRRSISEAINLSDRRSISGSCQLHGRRLISCYDEKQPQIQQLCEHSMTRHLHTRECWHQTGLRSDVWDIENSHEWLLNKIATGSNEELIKISSVLWGVWFARNKNIFENKNMTPGAAVSWSETKLANKKPLVTAGQGDYINGKVVRRAGRVSVVEAELCGIAEALAWAQEVIAGEVVIESDSLTDVNAVRNGQENLLELGDIVHHCKDMLRDHKRFMVSFVRRQANQVAHKIARIPCELNSFIVISCPPSYLLETLLSESLNY
ncbi:hypothetical protein AgCh_035623 [Apium graveolens]